MDIVKRSVVSRSNGGGGVSVEDESIWCVVIEKDKLGHSSVNLRSSLVPRLRYGSCGQRRLPRAVCFQAFLRMNKPASRHDYILILLSHGFKAGQFSSLGQEGTS